jgi:hypothetical protein
MKVFIVQWFWQLVLSSLIAVPALAVWPPRDSPQVFGDPCLEILFFSALEAELNVRDTSDAALAAAAAGDEATVLKLQQRIADTRTLISETDTLFGGQLTSFMANVDGGLSPFQAFLMLGESPFTPGWHFGQNVKGEAFFNNQLYTTIQSRFNPSLHTPFYFSSKGMMAENSRLVVPALAGIGAEHSHSGSVFSLLNLLLSDTNKKKGTVAELKADPNYVRVNPFAFDLPNNGGAFRSASYTGLRENIYWLSAALTGFRSEWRAELGSPLIVPIARSASPSLLMELHQHRPEYLKGLIAISPLHPSDLEIGNRTLEKLVTEGVYKANHEANRWSDSLYGQMTWHKNADPFLNDLPMLILVGTTDPEETQALEAKQGWDIYREWERKYPHKVRFIIVEGAGHDLFATRDKETLHRVMKYVYRFFQFVLNNEKDMAAAFPIEPGEIRVPWKDIFWKHKENNP